MSEKIELNDAESIAVPQGAVYELAEAGGNDIASGNYMFPESYRIPNFCEGCPLVEYIREPQISRVKGLYPVNADGVIHIGEWRDYVSSVLLLNDASDSAAKPVLLGDLPIISPFSIQHEDPTSHVLSNAQHAVSKCESPTEEKRIFRSSRTVCMSGLGRIKPGWRLSFNPEDLSEEFSIVVGEGTDGEMEELRRSAQARKDAGRSLKSAFHPDNIEGTRKTIDVITRIALEIN